MPAGDKAFEAAYRKVQAFLKVRPRSIFETRKRILEKGAGPETARELVDYLVDQGLLDDALFARLWAESRVNGKGYGKGRVLRELSAKGVSAEIAREAVDTAYGAEGELDAALRMLNVKYRRGPMPARDKAVSFLTRGGHSFSTADKAWKVFIDRPGP